MFAWWVISLALPAMVVASKNATEYAKCFDKPEIKEAYNGTIQVFHKVMDETINNETNIKSLKGAFENFQNNINRSCPNFPFLKGNETMFYRLLDNMIDPAQKIQYSQFKSCFNKTKAELSKCIDIFRELNDTRVRRYTVGEIILAKSMLAKTEVFAHDEIKKVQNCSLEVLQNHTDVCSAENQRYLNSLFEIAAFMEPKTKNGTNEADTSKGGADIMKCSIMTLVLAVGVLLMK